MKMKEIQYVNNWFHGSSCGISGVRIWEYVLECTDIFEGVDHIIPYGDTGNSFRGYDMYYFYSCCWSRYQKMMEHKSKCPYGMRTVMVTGALDACLSKSKAFAVTPASRN